MTAPALLPVSTNITAPEQAALDRILGRRRSGGGSGYAAFRHDLRALEASATARGLAWTAALDLATIEIRCTLSPSVQDRLAARLTPLGAALGAALGGAWDEALPFTSLILSRWMARSAPPTAITPATLPWFARRNALPPLAERGDLSVDAEAALMDLVCATLAGDTNVVLWQARSAQRAPRVRGSGTRGAGSVAAQDPPPAAPGENLDCSPAGRGRMVRRLWRGPPRDARRAGD
jgi:hypothetical protein